MTDPSPTDETINALLRRVAEMRDRAAFQALFRHFAPRVKAYMRRLGADDQAAEDLAQETMLTLWRRADTFDPTRAAASTWVFTIARNRRIDRLRRARRPEPDPNDPALVPDPEPPADSRMAAAEAAARLRTALAGLPAEQAEVVALAYFRDQSQSTIAEALGLPLGTVKSRLRLALGRLRRTLDGADGGDGGGG